MMMVLTRTVRVNLVVVIPVIRMFVYEKSKGEVRTRA